MGRRTSHSWLPSLWFCRPHDDEEEEDDGDDDEEEEDYDDHCHADHDKNIFESSPKGMNPESKREKMDC